MALSPEERHGVDFNVMRFPVTKISIKFSGCMKGEHLATEVVKGGFIGRGNLNRVSSNV